MSFSEEAKKELAQLAESDSLRQDMQVLGRNRCNPFARPGRAGPEDYIEFVTQYNQFINHEPKPFKPMADRFMRL